ncbi:MAG: baseplate tail-tube junction protein [Candidatus Peribacteraceae bacterium]|nr:baseplate tail-tube junction protein [Candidatus Peribacteraceae bacterium]
MTESTKLISLQFPPELMDIDTTDGLFVLFEIFDRSAEASKIRTNNNIDNDQDIPESQRSMVSSTRSSSLRKTIGGFNKRRGHILLPMPINNLSFDYGQGWNADEIGNVIGTVAQSGIAGNLADLSIEGWSSAAGKILGQFAGSLERAAVGVASGVTPGNLSGAYFNLYKGKVFNPFVEVLYQGGTHRTFKFSYTFAPKSEQEVGIVKDIIKAFKYFAHPTLKGGGDTLSYFVPPAVFDIKFMMTDEDSFTTYQNKNLPGVSSCALTNIGIDYHGAGTPSYLKDKSPSLIIFTLTFMEMEMLTRKRFSDDEEVGF